MKFYNARSIQKALTIIGTASLIFLCLLSYILGAMYTNIIDSIIMIIIIISIIAVSFIIYFIIRKFYNSYIVFNEKDIKYFKNNKEVLIIEWDKIVSLGHYRMLDFFNIEWGPGFIGIDYIDENGVEQNKELAFSFKDAKTLQKSSINPKLNNII